MPYGTVASSSVATGKAGIHVAVVSSCRRTLHRLRQLLEDGRIGCTVEADSIESLEPVVRADALVIHVDAPRRERLEIFHQARSRLVDVPLVGLWPDDERDDARRGLRVGLNGVVLESQLDGALAPTIHAVCSGLVCLPRRGPQGLNAGTLSSREKQVLGMLIMGFTNAEIGQRLFLAESTVKSHVSSAYMKLGVRSRKDAAALILDPHDGLGTGILAIAGA